MSCRRFNQPSTPSAIAVPNLRQDRAARALIEQLRGRNFMLCSVGGRDPENWVSLATAAHVALHQWTSPREIEAWHSILHRGEVYYFNGHLLVFVHEGRALGDVSDVHKPACDQWQRHSSADFARFWSRL
jgi:hypothetical protein